MTKEQVRIIVDWLKWLPKEGVSPLDYLPLFCAWLNGKTIELDCGGGKWLPLCSQPDFDSAPSKYRVKPDEPKKTLLSLPATCWLRTKRGDVQQIGYVCLDGISTLDGSWCGFHWLRDRHWSTDKVNWHNFDMFVTGKEAR